MESNWCNCCDFSTWSSGVRLLFHSATILSDTCIRTALDLPLATRRHSFPNQSVKASTFGKNWSIFTISDTRPISCGAASSQTVCVIIQSLSGAESATAPLTVLTEMACRHLSIVPTKGIVPSVWPSDNIGPKQMLVSSGLYRSTWIS